MNEIKVGIHYSFFKMIFGSYFAINISLPATAAVYAIEQTKEYWILMDSEMRNEIIEHCEQIVENSSIKSVLKSFIKWAKENIDAEHRKSLQRPLVDMLPVVDLKAYKGDKKC